MKAATQKPWGVNLPLLYPQMDEIIGIVLREKSEDCIYISGQPEKNTHSILKILGITVVHVIANTKFALKAQEVEGVDAIVAEGF